MSLAVRLTLRDGVSFFLIRLVTPSTVPERGCECRVSMMSDS
jgi:hypothetical protein